MKIKVTSKIEVYEKNEVEIGGLDRSKLKINSHWNRTGMVVLKFGKENITVAASDLQAAIRNATNTGR